MAGQIIISNIKTDSDNAFSILANTGAVLFSANLANGITTGIADGSVTNAKLAGSITGDKITVGSLAGNVFTANTITGDKIGQSAISSNNIVSVNASVASVGTLPKARLPAGSVLQVVSVNKVDSFSTTSGTFVDITGLNVSITPISTTSRIYVVATIPLVSGTSTSGANFSLTRNGTLIGQGTSGTSQNTIATVFHNSNDFYSGTSFSIVDSPSTTSAITYQVRVLSSTSGQASTIGRRNSDTFSGSSSTLTVMEIAG